MKGFLKNTIEWIAQRLIVAAAARATEMIETATKGDEPPKSLPAPQIPQIELH